ncbi:MAG: N-acetylglucosamine-6-phosphate deacetylase [Alphaproteobacteria bacterium]|nr:N-acetylglucosamine-6-phosphate deacetylase [Alphaproteobacteria bacterium]
MSSEICLHNANLLTGYSVMNNCAVLLKSYKIIDVFNENRFARKKFNSDVKFIDMQGAYIAPGFMDTHIHGIGGYGTDDMSSDSILKMSEILPQYGVTSFIPTLYSAPKEQMLKAIRAVVEAMGHEKGAKILGMHLEGPFISPDRLGVQTPDSLSPVDISLMDELLDAAQGHIINMTLAPELKNMRELALYCISHGIVLQAGHTNATYEQMVEGMQVRILHTTHLFNAMSRMHHRDPGAVGAVFIHPEMSCELIADGIHINPEFIKFLLRCKPLDKLVLVTDSLKTTRQDNLPLIANGDEVYLDKCFYRKSDNVIAGSALTMIDGIKNLVSFGLTLDQAVQTASTNPAKIMRREHLGLIAPGYDADLVVFDKDYNIKYTIINGQFFNQGKTPCAF